MGVEHAFGGTGGAGREEHGGVGVGIRISIRSQGRTPAGELRAQARSAPGEGVQRGFSAKDSAAGGLQVAHADPPSRPAEH
jgi:hypothetical protein